MNKGKFIIMGNASWDSAGMGGNSSQQYARTLMRLGWDVSFYDPQGVWHLSPLKGYEPENTVVMCDFPYSQNHFDIFMSLIVAGCRSVVRICDHWKTLDLEEDYEPHLEEKFVKAADCVFALNPLNVERYAAIRPDIELLCNGVDLEPFHNEEHPQGVLRSRGRLNLGVVASFWFRDWINLDPLLQYAKTHPEDRIHLIGYAERVLKDNYPENIIVYGPKHWSETVQYMKQFDAGIIPYDPEVTKYINPSKAMDYLAAGLPVISCPNATLTDYPNTFFYHGVNDFETTLHQALTEQVSPEVLKNFLEHNTWENKVEIILESLERVPA